MIGARRTAVLVLIAVFLAGGAAGWVLEEVMDDVHWPSRHAESQANRPDRNDDPLDEDAEEEFLDGLGLSRSQHKAVDRLLDQREERLEGYWARKVPEIEALIDSTRTRIRLLLTPEQRQAYDQWVARQRVPAP
jgi:hypothetical protein